MTETEQYERTQKNLLTHYHSYPELQIQDLFKFLHQSAFGCEHLVSFIEAATSYIANEYSSATHVNTALEALDGSYCRLPLSYIDNGLSPDTFAKIFVASAKLEENAQVDLLQKLKVADELIRKGDLPFSQKEFEIALSDWAERGFPPVHHSDSFRKNYHPSYRVVSDKYVPFLPLLATLDRQLKKGTVILAIEGGSASGKTTLGKILEELYDCSVFHMDDFFLRPEQRTPERLAQAGGNIDWERFLSEVLLPLRNNKTVEFRKFDCSSMSLTEKTRLPRTRLTVIEGAYSMHPQLAEHYDISAFLNISPQLQRERILLRNSPQMARRFLDEWIPLENKYFTETSITSRCDLTIDIT